MHPVKFSILPDWVKKGAVPCLRVCKVWSLDWDALNGCWPCQKLDVLNTAQRSWKQPQSQTLIKSRRPVLRRKKATTEGGQMKVRTMGGGRKLYRDLDGWDTRYYVKMDRKVWRPQISLHDWLCLPCKRYLRGNQQYFFSTANFTILILEAHAEKDDRVSIFSTQAVFCHFRDVFWSLEQHCPSFSHPRFYEGSLYSLRWARRQSQSLLSRDKSQVFRRTQHPSFEYIFNLVRGLLRRKQAWTEKQLLNALKELLRSDSFLNFLWRRFD